jgi:hypothetical protein
VRSTIAGQRGALGRAVLACGALQRGDAVQRGVHGLRHRSVDGGRVVAGDVDRFVAVAPERFVGFGLGEPGQDCRVGDLVAVEVQDGQDGSVVGARTTGPCRPRPG